MKIIWSRLSRKLTLTLVAASALALATGFYAVYKMKDIWRGPNLAIDTSRLASLPLTGEALFHLSGTATRVAHLRLNDGPIFADGTGRFAEELLLAPGYNIIKLEATDRFGRRLTKILELAYLTK